MHQFDFSMYTELCIHGCTQQCGPAVSLQSATLDFAASGLFEDFHKTSSLNTNQRCNRKPGMAARDGQLGLYSPNTRSSLQGHLLGFQEDSPTIGFNHSLKAYQFQTPLPAFSSSTSSPPLLVLLSPPAPSQPIKSENLFYFPLPGKSLNHSSFLNLSGSSLFEIYLTLHVNFYVNTYHTFCFLFWTGLPH